MAVADPTNPDAPEWKRRRKTNYLVMGVGLAGFAACIGAAITGYGNASVDNGMYVSAGMAFGGAGLYVWQGLGRLKHGAG